jgi:hypothetical protein
MRTPRRFLAVGILAKSAIAGETALLTQKLVVKTDREQGNAIAREPVS